MGALSHRLHGTGLGGEEIPGGRSRSLLCRCLHPPDVALELMSPVSRPRPSIPGGAAGGPSWGVFRVQSHGWVRVSPRRQQEKGLRQPRGGVRAARARVSLSWAPRGRLRWGGGMGRQPGQGLVRWLLEGALGSAGWLLAPRSAFGVLWRGGSGVTRGLLVPLPIPRVSRLRPRGRPGGSWTPRGFLESFAPSPGLVPAHPLSLEPLQLQALLLTLSLPAARPVSGWQRAGLPVPCAVGAAPTLSLTRGRLWRGAAR